MWAYIGEEQIDFVPCLFQYIMVILKIDYIRLDITLTLTKSILTKHSKFFLEIYRTKLIKKNFKFKVL